MENFTIFLICFALVSAVFGGMIVILVVQNTAAKKDIPNKPIGKIFALASLVLIIFGIIYGSAYFGGGNNPIFSKNGSISKEVKRDFWAIELGVFSDRQQAQDKGKYLQRSYGELGEMGVVSSEQMGTYSLVFRRKFQNSEDAEYFKQVSGLPGKVAIFLDVEMPSEKIEKPIAANFWEK